MSTHSPEPEDATRTETSEDDTLSGRPRTAGTGSTAANTQESGETEKKGGLGALIKEIIVVATIALLLSFLVKTFIMRAFYIPSGSMENTLQVGDRIFVNKIVGNRDLQRGDIVVFHDEANWQQVSSEPNVLRKGLEWVGIFPADSQRFLVKRVIGLPGDHIKTTSDGKLSVNGTVLNETYLYPGDRGSDIPFDVTVPEGKLWVMGDHRSNSADSRYHMTEASQGFIPVDSVEGEGWFKAWPLNRIGGLDSGKDVFSGVPAPAAE